VLEEEDFERVPVRSTHTIDITDFVNIEEVDPIYYERSFYLEPEETGVKPYALLRQTLQETGRVALAKIALRQKEQLCLLRPQDEVIGMETMYYPDEVKSPAELELPADDLGISEREMQMARSLVDMLSTNFDPTKYKDEYRDALLSVVEEKVTGAKIAEPPPTKGKVVDLMSALRASLEEAQKGRTSVTETDGTEEKTTASGRGSRRKAG
jgi:DNA end-binding protein Ku